MTDHTVRVLAMTKTLATIKPSLIPKIDNDIFSVAQNEMLSKLGSSNYGSYIAMFSDNPYSLSTEFYLLNTGQRKLRMLETAEAYFCLYYLALRTKEMVDKQAFVKSVNIGDGVINPLEVTRLIDMRHQYYNHARSLISQHTDSGMVSFITPDNPDLNEYGIDPNSNSTAIPANGRRLVY